VLYRRPPDSGALEAVGFVAADVEDAVELWPDHAPALRLLQLMATQWRIGPGGASGLDYGVLFELMRRQPIADDLWNETLDDLRIMEMAALKEMRT
jgi:hypothetical protein